MARKPIGMTTSAVSTKRATGPALAAGPVGGGRLEFDRSPPRYVEAVTSLVAGLVEQTDRLGVEQTIRMRWCGRPRRSRRTRWRSRSRATLITGYSLFPSRKRFCPSVASHSSSCWASSGSSALANTPAPERLTWTPGRSGWPRQGRLDSPDLQRASGPGSSGCMPTSQRPSHESNKMPSFAMMWALSVHPFANSRWRRSHGCDQAGDERLGVVFDDAETDPARQNFSEPS